MIRTAIWLKRLSLLAVLSIVIAGPSVAKAQGKIAVIDLRRAVIETEDGLRVQAKLKELFDNRQTELEAKEKAFTVAKTAFDKDAQAGKLAERDLQIKYEALAKQQVELQQLVALYRREMQQRESELMSPIVQRLLALVQRLSAQQGYDMVLNKEAVSFVRRDLDVTDRVIQMYKNAKPPPPAKKP
jgi:outer membrane protein